MTPAFWRGVWWLPSTPETQSPGQLRVDADGTCRLEIVGSLNLGAVGQAADDATRPRGDRVPEIHGMSKGKPITLLDCFTTASDGFSASTRSYQDIHVQEALIGAHVARDEPAFAAAIVEIENLTSWLAHPNIIERSDDGEGQHATTSRPPDLSCVIDGWTITARGLAQPFRANHKHSRLVVEGEVSTYLVLAPPEPVAAREFHGLVHEISDLITLAAGEASDQISLTLIHREPTIMPERDGSTFEMDTQVESFGARIHTAMPEEASPMDWRLLFSCRDHTFQDLVVDWLRVRRRAPDACNVYFGLRYARPRYTETRLLLTAITAEALHKGLVDATALSDADIEQTRLARLRDEQREVAKKLGKTPTFRERAIGLAAKPDADAVRELIPDIEAWADRLKDARNNLAHTGNETTDDDIFYLEWVTSSLLALVLMAELGLSPETQRRAVRDILSPPR
ncbi:HEPN domain-containing protein [Microbacterium sp. ASV49]|uniref:ApeA N-terminal domain-containing protein n=1 Tax=Microbacterium candidum TaxID=3041922 RepID=A0ABT7MW82_9MICO|nr:HEPN domain-containing protein [Microbacterium sp. ASV49]MDL9978717.1 hypothetical protein [Microbacterium sp. ASV49]